MRLVLPAIGRLHAGLALEFGKPVLGTSAQATEAASHPHHQKIRSIVETITDCTGFLIALFQATPRTESAVRPTKHGKEQWAISPNWDAILPALRTGGNRK